MRALRALVLCGSLIIVASTAVAVTDAEDLSTRIDALWNFDDSAATAVRLRAERAQHAEHSRAAVEIDTQIARTLSLARNFYAAHQLLDRVQPDLAALDSRVRVRYLLERGRTFNSAGDPARALPLFNDAYTLAQQAGRPGDAFYAVDALHMLAIAAPPADQLAWNLKALAAADAASDVRARNWRGSLLHNLGWTYFATGDYATAVAYWQRALALREAAGDVPRTRVAKWTVARGLRAQGKLDDAERIQRALVAELAQAKAPDGFVFEELTEIALARNDPVAARQWAREALPLLRDDADFVATEPDRLAKVTRLAGNTP